MGFIFSLLVAIVFIIVIILSLGTYLLSRLLGGFDNLCRLVARMMGRGRDGQRTCSSSSDSQSSHAYQRNERASTSNTDTSSSDTVSHTATKVFADGEGTYIDYEEVR